MTRDTRADVSVFVGTQVKELKPETILHILSYLGPEDFCIPLHRHTHRITLKKPNAIFTFFTTNDTTMLSVHAMKLFFGYFANDPERAIYTIIRNVAFDDSATDSIPDNYLFLSQLFVPLLRFTTLALRFKSHHGRAFCQKFFEAPQWRFSSANKLDRLLSLDLSQNSTIIDDVVLERLCLFHFPKLQYLNLTRSTVNLKHLNNILARAPKLQTLIVDHTNAFECVAISKLSTTRVELYHGLRTYNTKLTTLSANHCLMDDDCFVSLLWHMPNITSLSVHHNKITLQHEAIASYSPTSIVTKRQNIIQVLEKPTISSNSLTHLDLSHNTLTKSKFMILTHPQAFPKLESFAISSCGLTETELNRLLNQLHRNHKLTSLVMSGYDLQELPGSLVLMTSLQKLDLSLVSDHIVSIDRVADPIDDEDLEMLRKTSNHIRPDQEWEHALSKNNYAGKMLVCISPSKGLDKNRMAEFKNKKPQKSLKRNQKALHLQLSRRQEAMRKVYSPNSPTYALSANDPLSPRSNSMLHLAVYSRNNIPFPVLEKQTFAPNVNILTALRFSENLVQLSLAHHLFTDSHLMHHIFSENLTSLDLSFNCITPEGAMHIANNLTWLKELNLSHNKIKNRAGRAICEMPNLTRLELANTGIINETLYGLVQGQNDSAIEYLDISYNFLSPKSFSCEIVFRQLPNLKHLNARNSMFVNDYELIKSLPYAKQLRHLDVRENKLIGERAKRFLSRDLKQPLQVLY